VVGVPRVDSARLMLFQISSPAALSTLPSIARFTGFCDGKSRQTKLASRTEHILILICLPTTFLPPSAAASCNKTDHQLIHPAPPLCQKVYKTLFRVQRMRSASNARIVSPRAEPSADKSAQTTCVCSGRGRAGVCTAFVGSGLLHAVAAPPLEEVDELGTAPTLTLLAPTANRRNSVPQTPRQQKPSTSGCTVADCGAFRTVRRTPSLLPTSWSDCAKCAPTTDHDHHATYPAATVTDYQ